MKFQHYFVESPEEGELITIKETIRGHRFLFYSTSNIFSKDHVDPGTKLLAETMVLFDEQKVLDLGCGYGVLGIVAKKVCPSCNIWLSDINELAVKYSKINAKLNKVSVNVVESNLFENINEKFDNIITNPPFTAGKELIKKFILESYEHLNSPGLLQLVSTKKFRYVETLLKRYFDDFDLMFKQGDYLIYVGIKSGSKK